MMKIETKAKIYEWKKTINLFSIQKANKQKLIKRKLKFQWISNGGRISTMKS